MQEGFYGNINLSDKTLSEKYNDIGATPQGIIDKTAASFIIRAKYNESLSKYKKNFTDSNGKVDYDGLQKKAMAVADEYASRVLSERTKGMVPLMFENKALKSLTQFQIEATSDFNNFLHDLLIQEQKDMDELGYSKSRARAGTVSDAISTMALMNIFNNVFEEVAGNRPIMDLLEVLKIAAGYDDKEDDEDDNTAVKILKRIFGLNVQRNDKEVTENLYNAGKEFASYIPFVNLLSDNSRIPVAGALSDIWNDTGELVKNLAKSETRPNAGKSAVKVGKNALKYFLPPGGGVQAGRMLETINTYRKGGNYNDKGQLRYPVQEQDKTPVRAAQSLLFGIRNLPTAKEYSQRYEESGNKKGVLSEKNTKLYESLDNVSYKDFTRVIDSSSKTKMQELDSVNPSTSDKWKLFKGSILSEDQASNANKLLNNKLTTKEQYMNIYEKYKNKNITLPDKKAVEKIVDEKIDFNLYSKYKMDIKDIEDEQKQIAKTQLLLTGEEYDEESANTNKAKIGILRDDKYSDEDREKLYKSVVVSSGEKGDKTRKKYDSFKELGSGESSEINTYFDYLTADLPKKDDVLNWIKSSDLTSEQAAFIKATKGYKLTNTEKQILKNAGINLEEIHGNYKKK